MHNKKTRPIASARQIVASLGYGIASFVLFYTLGVLVFSLS